MVRGRRHFFSSTALVAALACAFISALVGEPDRALGQDLSAAETKEDASYRAAVRDALSEYDGNNESTIETRRGLAMGGTAVAGVAAATMVVVGVLQRKIVSDARAESALSCVVLPTGISCAKAF
jgi:hypothetical protein